jgi:hypothetical protein
LRIKTKEWLAMTELERYMEIYRAYVRNQVGANDPATLIRNLFL